MTKEKIKLNKKPTSTYSIDRQPVISIMNKQCLEITNPPSLSLSLSSL